jgi:hypothetical protein
MLYSTDTAGVFFSSGDVLYNNKDSGAGPVRCVRAGS